MKYFIKKGFIIFLPLIFIILSFPLKTLAVTGDYSINFKRITVEDGLSQTTVEYMHQDKQGYVWIGTDDGLNKYNGSKFETYRYREELLNSISGNFIPAINEDNKGNLWVGTTSGVNKINLVTNEITMYITGVNGCNLSDSNITEIFVDNDGYVYIATTDGLNIYNEETDNFDRLYYSEDEEASLTDQFIYSVAEDSNGDLWVGTDNGLNKIIKETKKIIKFYSDGTENTITDNLIYKIYTGDEGYLWLGTYSGGLIKFDINSYEVQSYRANEDDKDSLQSDFVRYILRDSRGILWIATENGLSRFNGDEKKFITYKSKKYNSQSLLSDNISSLMEDSSGAIWVGTYEGISIFNPENQFKLYEWDPFEENSLSENMIAGIYEDEDGYLWVGTVHSGVNIINRKTGEITKLRANGEKNSVVNDYIRDITGIGSEIYIATADGLSIYNKDTNIITNYVNDKNDDNSLSHNDIRTLYIDSDGVLWIGTRFNLCTYDRNGNFTSYDNIFEENNLTPEMFTDIMEDKDGNMWFACSLDNGVYVLDKSTNKITNYKNIKNDDRSLSFNSTRVIAIDNNDEIWIGTQYGLNKFNKSDGTFTSYTEQDGLSNNFIYGILVDKDNNLWISTNNGISKFDQKTEKFITFNVNDGLQANEFNGYAYFKSNSGEMFFGGIKGLTTFDPSKIKTQLFKNPVTIDSVINSEKEILDYTDIFFDYKNNNIQINFFLPYYINTSSIQYGYMLEGLDKDWIYSENRSYVSYTNLDAGEYTFKVVAKAANGEWSPPTLIKFKVGLKPWKTPLAYNIYLSILVAIVYIVWNRVKLLNMLIEQKTAKLEEVYEENRKLDKKLLENMQYKNNYFLNLSHELRTPLNVILSSYQLITKLNEENKEIPKEKMRSYMESIKRNSDRLLNLISNIIDTSKIESGNYKLNIECINIIYHVEEIAVSMKDLIEERGITLIIDPEVEEKYIECDKQEIEKCIINIIGNAIKFTRPEGRIKISMFDLNDKVKISIKDNGVGIDPKYQEAIFNRFKQACNSISGEYGGSGLGLTLTKQLIELHGGEIRVESEVGFGSEFIIILPTKYVDYDKRI